jgi:hypothetical protein
MEKSNSQFFISFYAFSFYIMDLLEDYARHLTTGSGKQLVVAASNLWIKLPFVS